MPFLVYIVDLLDEPISDLKLTHYTTCGTGRRGTFVNTQFSRSYSAALLLGVRRADTRLMTVGDVSDSELRSLVRQTVDSLPARRTGTCAGI